MTAERMKLLADKKEFALTTPEKQRLDEEFFAGFSSEDDTIEAMYEVFDEYGYAMDTHTGVGLAIYAQYKQTIETEDKKDKTPIVVFATGNPYKFPQDVLYALSGNDVKDSFKGIKRLNLLTAMKPPKCLLGLRYRPERFKKKIGGDIKETTAEILRFVDGEIVPVPDQK
jgi:threonine synthase